MSVTIKNLRPGYLQIHFPCSPAAQTELGDQKADDYHWRRRSVRGDAILGVLSGATVKTRNAGLTVGLVMLAVVLPASNSLAQSSGDAAHKVRVALIKMPYQG